MFIKIQIYLMFIYVYDYLCVLYDDLCTLMCMMFIQCLFLLFLQMTINILLAINYFHSYVSKSSKNMQTKTCWCSSYLRKIYFWYFCVSTCDKNDTQCISINCHLKYFIHIEFFPQFIYSNKS